MTGVTIREARHSELLETALIYVECHRQDYPFLPEAWGQSMDPQREVTECSEWLARDPFNRAFVAMAEGSMLGYIAASRNAEEPLEYEGEIAALFVRRKHRNRGVGSALLRRLARYLQGEGCARVLVYTLSRCEAAGYYRRLGGCLLKQVTQRFAGQAETVDVLGWDTATLVATLERRAAQWRAEGHEEASSPHGV